MKRETFSEDGKTLRNVWTVGDLKRWGKVERVEIYHKRKHIRTFVLEGSE